MLKPLLAAAGFLRSGFGIRILKEPDILPEELVLKEPRSDILPEELVLKEPRSSGDDAVQVVLRRRIRPTVYENLSLSIFSLFVLSWVLVTYMPLEPCATFLCDFLSILEIV